MPTSYEKFKKIIGGNIKTIREARKLTLNRAAQLALLRWTNLRDIEDGEANPTLQTLQKIADALDVDIRELFDFNSGRRPPIKAEKKIIEEYEAKRDEVLRGEAKRRQN